MNTSQCSKLASGVKPVRVRGVSKWFGKKRVLRKLDFDVSYNTIWSLLGPNGSGKTTSLRILAGLIKYDEGTVEIMGYRVDPSHYPPHVRRMISYLPEEAGVYERLTGWENLLFFAKIYSEGQRESIEMAEYGAELTGLGSDLDRRAGEYSKGMKRRLLIARSLMMKPCIAILDEPTSGLDVFSSLYIRKALRNFMEENASTIILSSHNMLEVQNLSSEVAFIYKGTIVERGAPGQLLDQYNAHSLEEVYVTVVESVGKVSERDTDDKSRNMEGAEGPGP